MPIHNSPFQNFGKDIQGSWQHLNQCNILVVGNTGAGKTTLISSILNLPYENNITKEIKAYQSQEINNLTLYDTRGFVREQQRFLNIWQQKTSQQIILDLIEKRKPDKQEPTNHIHMVWYCFSAQTNRISEIDTDFIQKITAKEIPVVLVRTRSYDTDTKNDLPLAIAELESNLPVKELVLVLAEAEQIKGAGKVETFGLDVLQEVTEECLDDIAEKAFSDCAKARKDKALNFLTLPLIAIAVEQGLIPPIPIVKNFVVGASEAFLFKNIANIFGYQTRFSDSEMEDYIAIASIAEILDIGSAGLELKDYFASKFPQINENTGIVEALRILSACIANGFDGVKAVPFQEELGKILLNIAHFLEKDSVVLLSKKISFLNLFTVVTTSLIKVTTTLIFALIWIETLKEIKIREYKGEEVAGEQVQEIIQANIDKIRLRFTSLNPAI